MTTQETLRRSHYHFRINGDNALSIMTNRALSFTSITLFPGMLITDYLLETEAITETGSGMHQGCALA